MYTFYDFGSFSIKSASLTLTDTYELHPSSAAFSCLSTQLAAILLAQGLSQCLSKDAMSLELPTPTPGNAPLK